MNADERRDEQEDWGRRQLDQRTIPSISIALYLRSPAFICGHILRCNQPRRTRVRGYPKIVVPPPGPKAKAIVERDEAWAARAYIKEYPLVIAGGRGPMVEDVDGNRFLDFMAGIAVSSTGYNHPTVVKAVQDAAGRFLHICGSDFYFESMAALCERLGRIAPGTSRKRGFFTHSRTQANEGAIKLARYATRRTAIIAFPGAFDGRSTGAVSLTSSKARQHAGFGPLLPDVHHVQFAYRYRCQWCGDKPDCTRCWLGRP